MTHGHVRAFLAAALPGGIEGSSAFLSDRDESVGSLGTAVKVRPRRVDVIGKGPFGRAFEFAQPNRQVQLESRRAGLFEAAIFTAREVFGPVGTASSVRDDFPLDGGAFVVPDPGTVARIRETSFFRAGKAAELGDRVENRPIRTRFPRDSEGIVLEAALEVRCSRSVFGARKHPLFDALENALVQFGVVFASLRARNFACRTSFSRDKVLSLRAGLFGGHRFVSDFLTLEVRPVARVESVLERSFAGAHEFTVSGLRVELVPGGAFEIHYDRYRRVGIRADLQNGVEFCVLHAGLVLGHEIALGPGTFVVVFPVFVLQVDEPALGRALEDARNSVEDVVFVQARRPSGIANSQFFVENVDVWTFFSRGCR